MEWEYDPDADALYIGLIEHRESARCVEHQPGIIFDYDKSGNPIGIEVLNARKHLPKGALAALPVTENTYSLVEAAKIIGLDPATLRQQILRKRIRAKKYHRQWFVDQSALDEYLASRAPQGRRSRKKALASR